MAINLQDYKKYQKSALIIKELYNVIIILNTSIQGLKDYKYYTPVKDLVRQIYDTRKILEIHLNSHKKFVEDVTSHEKEEKAEES